MDLSKRPTAEVYFHRNSVLDDAFEHLTVGSEVRFAEEMGRKARRPARFVWWVSRLIRRPVNRGKVRRGWSRIVRQPLEDHEC